MKKGAGLTENSLMLGMQGGAYTDNSLMLGMQGKVYTDSFLTLGMQGGGRELRRILQHSQQGLSVSESRTGILSVC
jgi:hypothetical protein